MLSEYFDWYGDVLLAKAAISKASGKCRGFGQVKFSDPVSADLAITEEEGHVIDGREVTVGWVTSKKASLFVGKLGPDTTQESLWEYFEYFGEVASASVKENASTGSNLETCIFLDFEILFVILMYF